VPLWKSKSTLGHNFCFGASCKKSPTVLNFCLCLVLPSCSQRPAATRKYLSSWMGYYWHWRPCGAAIAISFLPWCAWFMITYKVIFDCWGHHINFEWTFMAYWGSRTRTYISSTFWPFVDDCGVCSGWCDSAFVSTSSQHQNLSASSFL
jgi:hypothetical protein